MFKSIYFNPAVSLLTRFIRFCTTPFVNPSICPWHGQSFQSRQSNVLARVYPLVSALCLRSNLRWQIHFFHFLRSVRIRTDYFRPWLYRLFQKGTVTASHNPVQEKNSATLLFAGEHRRRADAVKLKPENLLAGNLQKLYYLERSWKRIWPPAPAV